MRKRFRLQFLAGSVVFAMIAGTGCSTDDAVAPLVGETRHVRIDTAQ